MPTKRTWIIIGVGALFAVGMAQNASNSRQPMRGMPAQYQMQGQYPQGGMPQGGMDESALAAMVLQQGAAARAAAAGQVNGILAGQGMAPMSVPGMRMPIDPQNDPNQLAMHQILQGVTTAGGQEVPIGPNGNYYWKDNRGNLANTSGPLSPGRQFNFLGQGR